MSSSSPLAALGWDLSWAALAADHPAHLRPARVTLQGRDAWRVHDGSAEHTLTVRGRLRADPHGLPVSGDWVLLGGGSGADAVIEHVVPRRSVLARKVAGRRTDEQVVAANVDVVLVCTPVHSVNARRLERELTLVWESGALPVVAITKCDLVDDVPETVADVESVAVGAQVLAVSALDGQGLHQVRALVPAGVTVAVIGPSGAGKSTLVNALVGHELLATTAVRADHRGVHTTTGRHLVAVPGGGMLLDTPGMREIALWADEGALDATFVDVDDLAGQCRFHDCRHEAEPGCAVQAAVEDDRLDLARLESWRKLQRELAFLARKKDARLAREERRAWARLSAQMKGHSRP